MLVLRCLALCLALVAVAPRLDAQRPPATRSLPASGPLRVFLDCPGFTSGCALDYFVVELPFANWTRDRLFADVQLLVTTLTTGSGGTEWTVAFIGRERFEGMVDTLSTSTIPNASEDDIRRALKDVFVRGLYRYALRTPQAADFTVQYAKPTNSDTTAKQIRDPWNFWAFETSMNAFLNGEQQQRFANLSGTFEARHITDQWKIVAGWETEYSEQRFTLQNSRGEPQTFTNILRNDGARIRTVRRLSPRWSAGVVASARRSDFLNTNLALRGGPVVEANLFPWSEATRRQLTASYAVAANHFDYQERTLLGRLNETRPNHALTLAANLRQKWGSVDVSARGSQFLHDLARTELSVGGSVRLQLVKGLSLTIDGRYTRVRDQLYLPGERLSNEEILVQQRALATGYSYFTFVGVSYTFGSIYNTIVNPRLDSFRLLGSGGF